MIATRDIRIRLFASAQEAAGTGEIVVPLIAGATIADALALAMATVDDAPGHPLVEVLHRCSFLVDGVAATERSTPLDDASTLDVLPPFAGG